VTSRNMLTVWFSHGVYMVHAWMIEMKSRVAGMTLGHIVKIAEGGLNFYFSFSFYF